MRFLILLNILVAGFLNPSFAGASKPVQTAEVLVGGRTIILPVPDGFVRSDGINPAADKLAESFIGSTNRYLARFDDPNAEPNKFARNFNAQVMKSIETQEIGEKTFAEARQEMKDDLLKNLDSIRREVNKNIEAAGKKMGEEVDADVALSISNTAVLGIFGNDPGSLGFSLAMNMGAKVGDQSVSEKCVAACVMLPVNGRLLYLYVTSAYNTRADREWVEKAALNWRDAILSANPRVDGPAGFSFSRLGRSALIGGLVGGVVGAVAVLMKKFRKKA